ncbi:EAL domain-containing protein [Methylobacterium sp. WL12]|uniref:EAL domain-containing protein n=1 Tax=Methylobacterium sp. WL12 TaxID=2603890 RepID=UPI0011C9BEEF|nr:EAL domain-containing protein [Methylobacterium sp. WL12]TXM72431.1 EAL domain-containing protein [Methylobacterium sp. WL12]
MNALYTTLDRRLVPAGSLLFAAGQPGDAAYLIISGRLEVFLERPDGDLVLAQRGPGEIVGEMAILDKRPRSASVRALEDSALVAITEQQLAHRIAETDPILCMCLGVVLDRYRETVALLEHMKGSAPPPAEAKLHSPSGPTANDAFTSALNTLVLEREIRDGVRAGQFEMHYQPIVRLSSRRLAGFEALMRWRHPHRGMVPPVEFIPVAEASGLISELTAFALAEAGRVLPEFMLAAMRNVSWIENQLFMSVNVSGHDLAAASFPQLIADLIARTGIEPDRLKIEVTESMLMRDPERAAAALAECRLAGLGVAIDDFGTGYSSLSYLSTLPITTLKIDRAFVRTLLTDRTSRRIVQTILRLADDLEIPVVAEGIEQIEEADLLTEMGCALGQGYLFGKPMPLDSSIALTRCWAALAPAKWRAQI